jgi:hypothetical protein
MNLQELKRKNWKSKQQRGTGVCRKWGQNPYRNVELRIERYWEEHGKLYTVRR